MPSKFHSLDTESDRAVWREFFQHAFGGTIAQPVALELKHTPNGAVIARGITADGKVKIFRTDTDAERDARERVTANYLGALDRINALSRKNRHPEKFCATAYNVIRGMAPGPRDSVSVSDIVRRLIEKQDHDAGTRDRRKEIAYRAIRALNLAGHIYYRPTVDDGDRIAVTESDDGGFDSHDTADDWLDA